MNEIFKNFDNTKNKIFKDNYLNSFIRDEQNQNNKFKRFIKELKINIFNLLKSDTSKSFIFESKNVFDINSYILDAFNLYYFIQTKDVKLEDIYEYDNDYSEKEIDFLFEMHPNLVLKIYNIIYEPNFINKNTEDLFDLFMNNKLEINKIIDNAFKIVTIEYISYESALNPDVNEFNYSKLLMPTNTTILYKLLNDVIKETCVEFEQFLFTLDKYNINDKKYNEQLLDENKCLKKEIEKLKKELELKEISIQKLQKNIESEKEICNKKIKQSTESYKEEIYNLNKLIKTLQNENEELKNTKKNKIIECNNKIIKPKTEIDINFDKLKILFVVSNNSTFSNDFDESFKNCKVVYRNYKIDFSKYEYVIVITSHIDHATYGTIKDKCKKLGVKFLHCSNTNVEKIKELIIEKEKMMSI